MKSPSSFLGAISALLAVALGAFGAHGLKNILSPELLTTYQTGVTYQMWHALGLLVVGIIQQQEPESKLLTWTSRCLFFGILLFSGSLYLLALLNIKELGMLTPIGGVSFIIAWTLLAIFAAQKQHQSRYKNARR